MFGFLKQKLNDFSSKLKNTISKEEDKKTKERPPEKKETKKEEKVQAKTETKKEKKNAEKSQVKKEETQPTISQKELKKDISKEDIKPAKEEKKQGLLGKILGLGKAPEKKEAEAKEKKKTKEAAEELEEKMFREIDEEIKKEEKIAKKEIQPPKQIPVTKKEEILEEKEVLEQDEEEIEEINEEAGDIAEQETKEKPRDIEIKHADEDKRELKAKVGVGGGLKGLLFGGIEINEKQIEDLLWELELSLIESDVEQDAAREIVSKIKQKLIGTKVSAKNIDEYLKEQIKEILSEMMETEKISLLEEIKEHKPLKILILGPNGAGKTTSIAKLVNYFHKHKKTCVVAAADTFRAGAIDQLEVHANKLGVRVIKQQYGADPAAVAFDAVKAAEAGKIDVVMIDSAGRQETNKNLMEELRKIERVAKPDLKLYVGEAYVGQTLLEQVDEFKEIVGIDGFILTKIDTDAKGGTAISLLYKTKKPILFVGTGQGYDDFEEFTPHFVLERII